MNYFSKKLNFAVLTAFAITTIPFNTLASDFSIPFINVSSLGTVYSGWAAEANDASTAFANPAGLVRISNQQLVIAGLGVSTRTSFTGEAMPPFPPAAPQSGTASSNTGAFLSSFYYAAPINNDVVFAFGQTIPFGLGTNYGKDSIVRYSATRTQITDFDVGPSVGIKINDHLSIGAGLDIQYLLFSVSNMISGAPFIPDMDSLNYMRDWGYGWHAGLLYQFTPCTRLGFDYRSQAVFHPHGDSKLYTVLAGTNGDFRATNQYTKITLPQMAQLSLYHDLNQRWTVMGSIFYTDWTSIEQITLANVMTPVDQTVSNTVPFNYHRTFDYAAGLTYKATKELLLRTGIQFVQTPSNDRNRIVADPVGQETVVGFGAHYQQNCRLGYDIGYTHVFYRQMVINNSTPFDTTNGHSKTASDVIGAQLTWNIV